MPPPPLLDVVTVPDFQGDAAAMFEARTLFFLASWLERAHCDFSLHLACIGEPPASVRRLADRCRAEISVHAPLRLNDGLTSNKLRGLETAGRSPRMLLLDSDVLVLGDLAGLVDAVPPGAVAAAPAGHARLTEPEWVRIYAALGLPPPAERMLSVRGQLGLAAAEPMSPYYNSGVLLLPRAVDLRALWERDLAAIRAACPELPAAAASDQAGLATALHRLRLAGVPFETLPTAYHVIPPHFAGGALPLAEVRLFHAVHFLRGVRSLAEIEPALEASLTRWTGDIEPARRFVRDLWRDWVRPALL